jgi:hypothetical protein
MSLLAIDAVVRMHVEGLLQFGRVRVEGHCP